MGKKKKEEDEDAKAMQALQAEEERQRKENEMAIMEHKKKLQEEAKTKAANPAESAIVNEVREFAEENPEIAAALIRSMMKEEK